MTGRELAALSGQDSIVVIRRPFVQWLGNIGRALLFDQLLFEGNEHGGDWFAITDGDWQNRLLLSRREIRDARDHLTGLGILESEQRGMPRRTWYKLDADKAAKAFSDHLETGGASTLEWPNGRARLAKRPGKSGQMATHSIQGGEGILEGGEIAANDAPPPAPLATLDANTSKASNGQPTDTDQTPPPVPGAPPKPARKPRASKPAEPAAPREPNVFFDAFCKAFGLPADGGKKAGLAGAFAVDCKREGATLDQFRAFYRAHAGEWGKFTCQPHNVGGAFLAWRIGQGMAGDPMADAAEIMPDGKPYNPYNVKHYLARKAAREAAALSPRFEAAL